MTTKSSKFQITEQTTHKNKKKTRKQVKSKSLSGNFLKQNPLKKQKVNLTTCQWKHTVPEKKLLR